MVLYRKYRPQKIAEIDSQLVREKLETILSSGRIPHAFLFSGPKGTGKTSSARILAKSVNCERNAGKGEPCNKCATCLSITNGNNLDIIEIDAASNRGIDEIRELRDKIRLAPAGAKKKIYIIDEVHMLTNEAFNALLKTLEEPPEHALFILCTTNREKLPETIISRCTEIVFRRAKPEDLIISLKRVRKGEEREIEEEALAEIAKFSEGSYRDAHKLLEEVLTTYPRAKITLALVKKTLGDEELLSQELLGFLVSRAAKDALVWVGKAVEKGVDLKMLIASLLQTFHQHLLWQFGLENKNFVYHEKLKSLSVEELKFLLSLFSQAGLELRNAVIPQLPVELAIIEWCEKRGSEVGGDELSQLDDSALRSSASWRIAAVQKNTPFRSSLGGTPPRAPIITEPSKNKTKDLENKWQALLVAVKPYNHSVAGLLRSCQPIAFDGENLKIEVFYKFHYDKLSETKVNELLAKVAEEVFGKKVKVFPSFKPKS